MCVCVCVYSIKPESKKLCVTKTVDSVRAAKKSSFIKNVGKRFLTKCKFEPSPHNLIVISLNVQFRFYFFYQKNDHHQEEEEEDDIVYRILVTKNVKMRIAELT